MKQKLFESFTSRQLNARIGRLPSGRPIVRSLTGKRIKETLLYLNRRLRQEVALRPPKLGRQIGNRPAAEAMIVETPNAKSSLEFGSHKFVQMLIQAYFVHENYPELFEVLLVDNPAFSAELHRRVQGLPRNEAPTHSEPEFTKIVWCLSDLGPRALGGTSFKDLQRLRIKYSLPKRPKEKVFRRGYNDQGSLASDDTKSARLNEAEYQTLLQALWLYFKEGHDVSNFEVTFQWKQQQLTILRNAKWKIDLGDRFVVDSEKRSFFLDRFYDIIHINELSGESLARDLNQIARRG